MLRKLDNYDRRILTNLQRRGDLGPVELADLINLSSSQCSRRLQRLKAEGWVNQTVALLNEKRLQIGVVVYVQATLSRQGLEAGLRFRERIGGLSEVTECHKLAGDSDYMLKVCTKDLESYNAFLDKHLLRNDDVEHVRSQIVLESVKSTTQLPLEFV